MLSPANGYIEQLCSCIIGISSLCKQADVPLSETVGNVDNHCRLLVTLIAMNRPNNYVTSFYQLFQYISLRGEWCADPQAAFAIPIPIISRFDSASAQESTFPEMSQ